MCPASRSLRCAIAHMVCRLGDTPGNMAEAARLSALAAREGARLILLPEGGLTGNALTSPDRQAVLPLLADAFVPLRAVADSAGIAICAGFATPLDGRFNVVHAIVLPGGGVLFQRKAIRAKTEPPFLAPWPDPARTSFIADGARVAIAICSEFGVPAVMAALAEVRPDLLLHPSAGSMKPAQVGSDREDDEARGETFRCECRAIVESAAENVRQHGIPRVAANPIGFDGETWWPGNSYAVDASGEVRLWLPGESRPTRMISAVAVTDMPLPA